MSHGGDSGAAAQMAVRDARAYSPSCLPRTPSRRKHCKCNASPRWCEEHEVPNPIRNKEQKRKDKKQKFTCFTVFLVGRGGLNSCLRSLCRKLRRADTKQRIQFLDDSIRGAFSVSFSSRVVCIQWLELLELCNRRTG